MIEALLKKPHLNLELFIYGALFPSSRYIENIKEISKQDLRIHFQDAFPPENLGQILEEIDYLAVPALWYENEPLVVKAALEMSVPVLASNIGTLADMIDHKKNGFLISPGNVLEWENVLELIASIPPLKPEVKKFKTIQENAKEMVEIYEKYSLRD